MNREEMKLARKKTDRARRFLIDLDGTWKSQPAFDIVHHPRAFNKPMSCQLGKHDLEVKVVMNIPFYYCKKCGWGNPKGIIDGVETKHETRTRHVPPPLHDPTPKEYVEEYFNRRDNNERK